MSELPSFSLKAALVGGYLLGRVERALPELPTLSAVPELPAMPGLPELPDLAGLAGRVVDHAASFVRSPSGLFVPAGPARPAGPALIGRALPIDADLSGTAAGQSRPPGLGGAERPGGSQAEPRGGWSDVVDLDGLVAFLRRTHPLKPAMHVAALTGESVETVRKWLRYETRPGMRATIVLVCVYGLPLVEACVRRHPVWLVAASANRGRHALADQLAALRPQIDAALGDSA